MTTDVDIIDELSLEDIQNGLAIFRPTGENLAVDQYDPEDAGSVWGNDMDIGGGGNYVDWVGFLREGLRPRFDTLEDFIPDSKISDDQEKLVVRLFELGKLQLHAPCFNRLALLQGMQTQIEVVQMTMDDGAPPAGRVLRQMAKRVNLTSQRAVLEQMSSSLIVMRYTDAALEKMMDEIRGRYRITLEEIERAKRRNSYADYTVLRIMMAQQKNRDISTIALELPPFLSPRR